MADNTLQTGSDTIRDKDRAGVKTQIVGLDLGIGTGTESLMSGTLPVVTSGDTTAGTITNTPAVASVTTTAASVLSAGTYRAIVFENTGTDYVYIGATGVTASSYFKRLSPGEVLTMTPPFVPSNAVYAIGASAGQSLAIGVLT